MTLLADIAPCVAGCVPAPPVVLAPPAETALIVPTPLLPPPAPLDDEPPTPAFAPPCATSSVPKLVTLPLIRYCRSCCLRFCAEPPTPSRANSHRHLRQWRAKQSRWEQPLRIAAGLSAAAAATHAAAIALFLPPPAPRCR